MQTLIKWTVIIPTLKSEKRDLTAKNNKDKGTNCIMIEGSIHQDDKTNLNLHTSLKKKKRASKYIKQKLSDPS